MGNSYKRELGSRLVIHEMDNNRIVRKFSFPQGLTLGIWSKEDILFGMSLYEYEDIQKEVFEILPGNDDDVLITKKRIQRYSKTSFDKHETTTITESRKPTADDYRAFSWNKENVIARLDEELGKSSIGIYGLVYPMTLCNSEMGYAFHHYSYDEYDDSESHNSYQVSHKHIARFICEEIKETWYSVKTDSYHVRYVKGNVFQSIEIGEKFLSEKGIILYEDKSRTYNSRLTEDLKIVKSSHVKLTIDEKIEIFKLSLKDRYIDFQSENPVSLEDWVKEMTKVNTYQIDNVFILYRYEAYHMDKYGVNLRVVFDDNASDDKIITEYYKNQYGISEWNTLEDFCFEIINNTIIEKNIAIKHDCEFYFDVQRKELYWASYQPSRTNKVGLDLLDPTNLKNFKKWVEVENIGYTDEDTILCELFTGKNVELKLDALISFPIERRKARR